MYDALNKGIDIASGDIVGILNADDFYIDKEVISKIVNQLETAGSDSIYADLYYVDEKDTDKISRYWKSGAYIKKNFKYGWMPPHPTFFVKKEVYNKWGKFNLSFSSAADYELMLRFLFKNNVSTTYLNEVIVKMREGGMSNVSLRNRLRANREDKRAWKVNGLRPASYTLLAKPLRKITQFIKK